MNRALLYLVTLSFLLTSNVTRAEDEADPDKFYGGTFSTWVELATDYVFRGESETNDGEVPSTKVAVTWSHDSGAYVGFYLANNLFPAYCRSDVVDKGSCADNGKINSIVGPYIGWSGAIFDSGFSLNSLIFSYHYSDDSTSNYIEMFNTLTLPNLGELTGTPALEKFNLNLEYSVTFNEWFGVGGTTSTDADDVYSHYFAFHPSISLPYDLTLSATYGWQIFTGDGAKPITQAQIDASPSLVQSQLGADPDWQHWSIGLSKTILGWNMTVAYHDTDIEIDKNAQYYDGNNNDIVDERIIFQASRSF